MFITENFLDYVDKASKITERDSFEKTLTHTQKRLSDKINGKLLTEEEETKIVEDKPKKKKGRPKKNPIEKLSEVKVIAEEKKEAQVEEDKDEEIVKEKIKEEKVKEDLKQEEEEEVKKSSGKFLVIGDEVEEEPEEIEVELTPLSVAVDDDTGTEEPEEVEVEVELQQDSMLNIPQQPMYIDQTPEILSKVNILEENIKSLTETITTLTNVISAMSNKNKKRIVINRDNTGKIINADLIEVADE